MTDRESFVRSICEEPADDVRRLAFADFLTESGEGDYATYIRWLCKPGFRHPFPRVKWRKWFNPWWSGRTVHRHLFVDSPALLVSKVREGTSGYKDWHQLHVTRGFISRIEMPLGEFAKSVNSIFAAHPVTDVRIRDVRPWNSDNTKWGWSKQTADYVHDGPNWVLPPAFFDLLPVDKCCVPKHSSRRWWHNEADAYAALNTACVAYGRSTANLPPLTVRV